MGALIARGVPMQGLEIVWLALSLLGGLWMPLQVMAKALWSLAL